VCPSVRIAGNSGMQLFHAESKRQNTSSARVPTNPNTIDTLLGAARQMRKQIPQDWKQRKRNYAHTSLST